MFHKTAKVHFIFKSIAIVLCVIQLLYSSAAFSFLSEGANTSIALGQSFTKKNKSNIVAFLFEENINEEEGREDVQAVAYLTSLQSRLSYQEVESIKYLSSYENEKFETSPIFKLNCTFLI